MSLQNQNPFVSFSGVWRSLPWAAQLLLMWGCLQSILVIAYAATVFAHPESSQQFVFPLLVRALRWRAPPAPVPLRSGNLIWVIAALAPDGCLRLLLRSNGDR